MSTLVPSSVRGRVLRALVPLLVLPTTFAASPAEAAGQVAAPAAEAVERGRFDFGKMWTFEYPPGAYFTERYGFPADADWFEGARLPALRIPGCSASFVSPQGLVVTNHHCARSAISRVSRPGENLLDQGFYAESLEDERPIPGYWADQLVHVEDVTDEVFAAAAAGAGDQDRQEAVSQALEAVRERLEDAWRGENAWVQTVPLYNGGRYSAYVFRRFTDVRLVMGVELAMGFFGGDPDNFTYPRYALDYAFYRVYGEDGRPWEPERWFRWGEGVGEGDPVFIIGNPGPTNRLQTVAQLEYQRDISVPVGRRWFESRLQAFRDAYAADPVRGEELGLRNRAFGLSNSLKAYTGRLAALENPEIMARKAAAQVELAEALAADAELAVEFGGLLEEVRHLQREKRLLRHGHRAFYRLADETYGARSLARARHAVLMSIAGQTAGNAQALDSAAADLVALRDHPGELEEDLLALRLADLERYLAEGDPLVEAALDGRSPEGAAASLLARSVLADQASARAALDGDGIPADDPLLVLAEHLHERAQGWRRAERALARREALLDAELGRARFAVYGTEVAPDATFSPRITDGVVRGYAYNGTLAPPHTTLYGIYDRHFSHGGAVDWQLPDRWLPAPEGLDLATPLNFVSTADTYGGNSGSPAVTPGLALVGLNFDRNIEGLSRDFIYLPEEGRNVMVDVRAIRASLETVYGADRIVREILAGRER